MIQDLAFGRLENEFRPLQPYPEATVVCFQGTKSLVSRDEQGVITLRLGSATPSHFPHPHCFPTHQNLSHPVAKMYLQTVNYNHHIYQSIYILVQFYEEIFLRF